MTFINHSAFVWALLAVPIVLFYLWRLPPRRHLVGTGFLWEQVFSSAGGQSAWWKVRRPVSLGVQLAVLALVVAGLAEPHARPPRQLVIVIDNSASMNATDAERSRLDEARQRALEHIEAIGPRDQVAILTGGDPLRVACRPTGRLDTLRRALDTVSPTEGPTRVLDAVAIGQRLLDGSPAGRILVLTDGCFDGAADLAGQDDVRLFPVGGRAGNLAITRLDARRDLSDPPKCQVFVEVTSFSDEPVECGVGLELDGKPIDRVPIALETGGRWRQVFEMASTQRGRLTAQLDRPDVLESDNRASVDVPGQPIRQVAAAGQGNLSLEKALEASAGVAADGVSVGSSQWVSESDVRSPAGLTSRTEMDVPGSGGPPLSLWLFPTMAALLLVAAEWHLFQRRWTC